MSGMAFSYTVNKETVSKGGILQRAKGMLYGSERQGKETRMKKRGRERKNLYGLLMRAGVFAELAAIICLVGAGLVTEKEMEAKQASAGGIWEVLEKHQQGELVESDSGDYIKWVDFTVPAEAMDKAYQYDVDSYGQEIHVNWIELLAYAAAKQGGNFGKAALKNIDECAKKLQAGESIDKLTEKLKYYPYYLEAYTAVLGGFVGEYEMEGETRYGLKAFSPIAAGFYYTDYDDFGASRSYGYARPHLGHDMMGQIGTPIIAAESGYVEALGWNQYGGWRIGIRSFDKKRYYYYAHLRQNYPYAENLKEGDIVSAGDVIGYMGHTGYSAKENVNNIETIHLHFGLELVFDESQKESNNEIWINCYELVKFLAKNRSEVYKVEGTKEWKRVTEIKLPEVENADVTVQPGT